MRQLSLPQTNGNRGECGRHQTCVLSFPGRDTIISVSQGVPPGIHVQRNQGRIQANGTLVLSSDVLREPSLSVIEDYFITAPHSPLTPFLLFSYAKCSVDKPISGWTPRC